MLIMCLARKSRNKECFIGLRTNILERFINTLLFENNCLTEVI